MTNTEIRDIQELQCRGLGYRRIASILNLPINTVKSYCQRHPVVEQPPVVVAGCKNCGSDLGENAVRYRKQFCCDQCRMDWWKGHRRLIQKNVVHEKICENCGAPFEVYGKPNQRFCSRICFHAYRRRAGER